MKSLALANVSVKQNACSTAEKVGNTDLADRAGALVATVNNLIADIESDVSAPSDAAFHAKDAYAALNRAHNTLLEAIAEARVCHYTGLARDAQKAAA